MEAPGQDNPLDLAHDLANAPLAEAFARAAVAAGAVIMEVYGRDFTMRAKKDATPVCEADERSEALILTHLEKACPGVPVVAEEAFSRGDVPVLTGDFILVDPLDGTREFARRNGEFTVNIALIRNGAPVCAALYAPAFGRLWLAAGKALACQALPGGEVPPLSAMRQIHVRKIAPTGPVAAVSRSHRNAETEALMTRLGATEMREAGSAMKFCLIAEGEADVYPRIGPTMEWDIAAGDAVLRAAGGMVTGLDGAPVRYGRAGAGFASPDFVAFGDPSQIVKL